MIRLIRDIIIGIAALYIIVIGLSWAFETLSENGMLLPAIGIFVVAFQLMFGILFMQKRKK